MVPTRIIDYYGDAKSMTTSEANAKARDIYDEIMDDDFCPIVEYGICYFKINKTWKQIFKEAKKLATKELKILQKNNEDNFYEHEIRVLQNIIKE